MSNVAPHPGRSLLRAFPAAAGIVVASLLVGLCGRTEASCGDWLAGHARMEPAAAVQPVALVAPLPGATLPVHPVCDGPACRGVPPLPVLPGEGVAVDVVVDPACLASLGGDSERPAVRGPRWWSDCRPLSTVGSVPTPPPRPVALPA